MYVYCMYVYIYIYTLDCMRLDWTIGRLSPPLCQVEALSAPRIRPEFLVRRWRPASPEPVEPVESLSLPARLAKKDQVNRRAKEQLAGWDTPLQNYIVHGY